MQDSKTSKLPSAWPAIGASIIFSIAVYIMLYLYSFVHWNIMFNEIKPYSTPIPAVYTVLKGLAWLRLSFTILAIIWAAWSFKGIPRWGSIIALVFAFFAVMTNLVVM